MLFHGEGSTRSHLLQDWAANPRNPKGRLVMIAFRAASRCSALSGLRWAPLRLLVGSAYRLAIEWVLGVEIPWRLALGPSATLWHGVGLVINDGVVIGSGVVLRNGVTIGHKQPGGGAPRIGDDVEFGANSCVIGAVTVGDGAVIGAGAVVVKDVPAGATVVGNPARIL